MKFRLYRASANGQKVVGITEGIIDFAGGDTYTLALELRPDDDPYKDEYPNLVVELIKDGSD